MPELALRIEDYDILGWQSCEVQLSLDDAVGSFALALTSPFSSKPPPVDVLPGAEVKILYDGEQVLVGYIDDVDESSDAGSFNLTVTGRSRAKDLVDSSALHKGAWRNKSLLTIAAEIAEPFGVRVSTDLSDLPTERLFRLQDGETAFAAINRLVRLHALRVVSDSAGDLVLTRTGLIRFADVVIERGVNVVAGGVRRSETERFSEYIFKATLAASDDDYGEGNATSFAVVDEGMTRYRPLIVHRDGLGRYTGKKKSSELQEAAQWERNTRAGKSIALNYRVILPGAPERSWEMPAGAGLWTPNTIVTVRDPSHKVDGQFLVTSVTLRRSESGTETQLALTFPEAYEPEKPPTKRKKKGGMSW